MSAAATNGCEAATTATNGHNNGHAKKVEDEALFDPNHPEKLKAENKNRNMHYDVCLESAQYLLGRTSYRPKLGIICGTGLAGIGDLVESPDVINYADIPNFPVSTISVHKSRCLLGKLNGVEVFLMQGRFHLYEGYSIDKCAMPVRVMRLFGVEKLIVSNAAGGLADDHKVGDVMLIRDHLNLMGLVGVNPLAGMEDPRFGPRFFPMNHCYTESLRDAFKKVAAEQGLGPALKEGVYTMLGGPNFETTAELKMLKVCGADAVGMSTVHEAMTAHHCGMEVLAFSLITNLCILDPASSEEADCDEVFVTAAARADDLKRLVHALVKEISKEQTG